MDLRVSVLALNIEDAYGHEHRMEPIALRAVELLAESIERRYADAGGRQIDLDVVSAPSLDLDLSLVSDEEAANTLAVAWLDGMAIHLEA